MKKNKFQLILFFCITFACGCTWAQTTQNVIETVNELTANGRYEDAQVLLERSHRANPKDFKILHLYAQVSYINKKYDAFKDLYAEAMEMKPKDFQLKLEYAQMLYDINEYLDALPLLNEYLIHDPGNVQALLAKAKICRYNEDYFESYSALSTLLSKDPSNAEARDLYAENLVLKSKWAKLTVSYASTSQPINVLSPVLQAGMYFSPLSSPKVSISPVLFQRTKKDNVNIYMAQVENRTFYKDFGVGIDYGAGLIMYPGTQFDVTAKVRFDKYAERYILLTLGAERRPYFSTEAAIDNLITTHAVSSSLTLITKESWNGKGTLESVFFDGVENIVTTIDSYLLTPRLKVSDFDFKLGYGINFSSSKLDKFVSDKTPQQILAGNSIPYYGGDYMYYTPKNLLAHSAIFSFSYIPTKETQASFDIRYGFIASAEKPYYIRQTNPRGDVFVDKGYTAEDFKPADINFSINSLITPKIAMNLDFRYSKNFFYISRSLILGVKVNFWK